MSWKRCRSHPGAREWQVVDPAVKDDFDGLAKLNDGDFFIVNRTEADDIWLVGYTIRSRAGQILSLGSEGEAGHFPFHHPAQTRRLAPWRKSKPWSSPPVMG